MIFMREQISWGPYFSGTKLLRAKISQGPKKSGAQMRLGIISVSAEMERAFSCLMLGKIALDAQNFQLRLSLLSFFSMMDNSSKN
jgi:hypothetical protein